MDSLRRQVDRLLRQAKLSAAPHVESERLSGDGSDRLFFKIVLVSGESCLAVFPSPTLPKKAAFSEAYSTYAISRHLESKSIAVPRVFAYDDVSGGILFEYLGTTLLYDIVINKKSDPAELYRKALDNLVAFQVKGVSGFNESYCWDTRKYDRQLMLTRESGYFRHEFCSEYLGLEVFPDQLQDDFNRLADRVCEEGCRFLLHRDYQSRNLMVKDKDIFIIDFQGARFGPLGYDVASLLNDPYVDLGRDLKNKLFDYYLDILLQQISVDRESFVESYSHIALQRNLQVLGAYAFLSHKKNKLFFRDFISPAFCSLASLISGELSGKYPALEELIMEIEESSIKPAAL